MAQHLTDFESALDGASAEHARDCPECARRIAMFLAESDAVRRWASKKDAPVEALWGGVQAQLQRPLWRRPAPWLAAAVAAAAALVLAAVLTRRGAEQEASPSAEIALEQAEHDYQAAIDVLESRLQKRGTMGRSLLHARDRLRGARSVGGDFTARVRVIEGYAAYLKSLRRALEEGEP